MTKAITYSRWPALARRSLIHANPNPERTSALTQMLDMFSYMRPASSAAEAAFCALYLDHIPGMTTDKAGNRIITIPHSALLRPPTGGLARSVAPNVLWSSHTDTVHNLSGAQKLAWADGWLMLSAKDKKATCLGADCTAGVWLMVQMIERSVPGLYVFHAGEEIGGIGSNYIATNTPELLVGIDYAIAFDRRGYESVVTHQFGGRCASDAFAQALADQLGGGYAPDDGGTFTDTANYTHLVPECTNLSVGYFDAHSKSEAQDITFLMDLLERLCRLDVDTLPVKRDPDAGFFSTYAERDAYDTFDRDNASADSSGDTLEELVWSNPRVAAQLLEEYGITEADFRAELAADAALDQRRRRR